MPPNPPTGAPPRASSDAADRHADLIASGRIELADQLAAVLAHELNQPLAAILSNAQAARRFLSRPAPDLALVAEIMDEIVRQDRRAAQLIQRLRTLFVKGEMKLQTLRLDQLLQDTISLARAELIEHGIACELRHGPGPLRLRGDRLQLQQLLLNLIANAGQAICAAGMRHGRIEIASAGIDGHVQVSVSDNGPGLDAAAIGQVFHAFFTTRKQGMGLGLAIASAIVQQHGGTIEASNRPEGGACFCVRLPRASAD